MPINTESKAFIAGKELRYLVDALWGDTPTMREAGTTLLPARSGELDDNGLINQNYKTRICETTLVNYLKPAVQNMSAKIFQKPIQIGESLEPIQPWFEDIDLAGCNINDFGIQYFESAVRHGVSFALVDAPANDRSTTLAEQLANNIRPYVTLVTADQLIGTIHQNIGNVETLTNIRISEKYTHRSQTDKYADEIKTQIREIELNHDFVVDDKGNTLVFATGGCTWRLWRESTNDKDRDSLLENNPESGGMVVYAQGDYLIDRIPLVPLYTNKTGELDGETYFKTLAYLNLAHWQSSSYQTNILNVVRVPRIYGFGLDQDTADQLKAHGAKNGIFSTQSKQEAEIGWTEAKGDSIQHGERDLAAKEEHMAILSLDPILKKAANTNVATIATIENQKANSVLEKWAQSLERSLIEIVGLMLEMSNQTLDVDLAVNDDFQVISDVAERVKELRELRVAREISRETFLEMLVRITFFDEDFDIKQELSRLQQEEDLFDDGLGNEEEIDEPDRAA